MTTPTSLESRLARIEQTLAALANEVVAIRAELRAEASVGAPDATNPPTPGVSAPPVAYTPPRPRATRPPRPRRIDLDALDISGQDVERLLGRYGMLGIAVIAAVAAVGTFLSWAIGHGYLTLGPAARVVLGMIFAFGVGVWGLRLRRRERSFGSSILGLSLVIVLVCAYSAGPSFHLVPTWVAFVGAAAISWTLAVFARSEDDEPLWCVAFGGAALAPFVTSDRHGSMYVLIAYGFVLLLSALFAISHRRWPVAWPVFYLVSALFVLTAGSQARLLDTTAFVVAFLFPLVIAAVGVLPFAPASRKRGVLRWLGVLALFTSLASNARSPGAVATVAITLAAAAALWLVLMDGIADVPQSTILRDFASDFPLLEWIDVAVIPLLLAMDAASVLHAIIARASMQMLAAVLFTVFAWRRPVSAARDAAACAALFAGAAFVGSLPLEEPLARIVAFLALGMLGLVAHRWRPSLSWVIVGAGMLVVGLLLTMAALMQRPAYTLPPFGTEPSIGAAAVLAALALVARFWRTVFDATRASVRRETRRLHADGFLMLVRVATLAAWVWAFVWALIELAMAFSPSASTLLLVTYFVSVGVACVAVGRAKRSARLRQTGLALALVGAATAVYGASTYFDIGARILAYLVTSAFLLGIAYWYRRPGVEPARA